MVILMAAILVSCEKTVDLKYKGNQSKIVIEGNITDEAGPYFVKITKSINLSGTGGYLTIDNAAVTINDMPETVKRFLCRVMEYTAPIR